MRDAATAPRPRRFSRHAAGGPAAVPGRQPAARHGPATGGARRGGRVAGARSRPVASRVAHRARGPALSLGGTSRPGEGGL